MHEKGRQSSLPCVVFLTLKADTDMQFLNPSLLLSAQICSVMHRWDPGTCQIGITGAWNASERWREWCLLVSVGC